MEMYLHVNLPWDITLGFCNKVYNCIGAAVTVHAIAPQSWNETSVVEYFGKFTHIILSF